MPSVQEIVSRTYTPDEVAKFYLSGELAHIALNGYVARADSDDAGNRVMRFVPFHEASDPTKPRTYAVEGVKEALRQGLPERTKRTPQQRVASLMVRIMAHAKQTGSFPGLSDEQVSEIVGEAWKTGQTEVTAEMVRKVAQRFMEGAQQQADERDRRRVTRYGGEGDD